MPGLLRYTTKQASVAMMEATFNSDYDAMLLELETFVQEEAEDEYAQIFALILANNGVMSEELRAEVRRRLSRLIETIYKRSEQLYSPWYMESFGHVSSLSTEQVLAVTGASAVSAALSRTSSVVERLIATIEKTIPSTPQLPVSDFDQDIKRIARRLALTESDGAVGTIIQFTAVSAFGTAFLYKRWISVGDERVRHTHRIAASKPPIPVTSLYRVGDTFMRFPADPQAFGGNVAAEVINCRCRSLVIPRTSNQPNSFALNSFLLGNSI